MPKWEKQKGLGIANLLTNIMVDVEKVVDAELTTLQEKVKKYERIERMKKVMKDV